jgi:acetyltransferase-like isoleucine patch superfamily enzyme
MDSSLSKPGAQQWNDPLLWKLWLLVTRAFHKIKSRVLAGLFRAPHLYLGRGCVVHGAHRISFGRNVYANSNLWLEAVVRYRDQHFAPTIEIGDNVSFSDSVHITCIHSIILKKGVLMGSRVYVSDHNHGVYKGIGQSHPAEPPAQRQLGGGGPVIICENVWIGDNAIILGPLMIGHGAIIAANSVVTRDVAPQTIVAGIPARPIKCFDEATGTWNRI